MKGFSNEFHFASIFFPLLLEFLVSGRLATKELKPNATAKPARFLPGLDGAGQNLAVADFHIDFSPNFAYKPAIVSDKKCVTILILYNFGYLQND